MAATAIVTYYTVTADVLQDVAMTIYYCIIQLALRKSLFLPLFSLYSSFLSFDFSYFHVNICVLYLAMT